MSSVACTGDDNNFAVRHVRIVTAQQRGNSLCNRVQPRLHQTNSLCIAFQVPHQRPCTSQHRSTAPELQLHTVPAGHTTDPSNDAEANGDSTPEASFLTPFSVFSLSSTLLSLMGYISVRLVLPQSLQPARGAQARPRLHNRRPRGFV